MHRLHYLPLVFCLAATAARADTGPCKPDAFGGTTCGEGIGAARVIDGTASPSKAYAFAWRSTRTPPTEAPDEDNLESVLIRLTDGAVLAKARGEYWNTGTVRINRTEVHASWSPDNRFAVEITDFRWMTEVLRLYSIGADGAVKTLDLLRAMETAARKQLKKIVKTEADYAFSVLRNSGGETPRLTIRKDGTIKALFLMQVPKREEQQHAVIEGVFKVTERGGALALKEVSTRRSRVKPW